MAAKVGGQIAAPASLLDDGASIARWLVYAISSLNTLLSQIYARLNLALPSDGSEVMTGPLPLKSYTTATKPSAAGRAGQVIFVSDGGAGNVFQGSNGTSWVSLG